MNCIDLSVFEDAHLDIIMPDKQHVFVVKPTEKMVIELMKVQGIKDTDNAEDILATLNRVVLLILNTNDSGKVFNESDIDALTLQMKVLIINSYSNFVKAVQSNPN